MEHAGKHSHEMAAWQRQTQRRDVNDGDEDRVNWKYYSPTAARSMRKGKVVGEWEKFTDAG